MISGKITNCYTGSRRGGSFLYYEVEDNNNKKNKYIHPEEIKYLINIEDKVTFRIMHNSNSVRILTVNDRKINNYYYLGDYFLVFYLILFIGYLIYQYKKYKTKK